MASSVVHSKLRTGSDFRQRSSCRRKGLSREAFVTQFQHLRDNTLPELDRVERMLTRSVIAYGLEYCHLDVVATTFLALARDVRRLLSEYRRAVLRDERSSRALNAAHQSTTHSLARFRDVITSDLACPESTPVYRRLIAALIEFESEMSRVLTDQSRDCSVELSLNSRGE